MNVSHDPSAVNEQVFADLTVEMEAERYGEARAHLDPRAVLSEAQSLMLGTGTTRSIPSGR